MTGEYRTSRPSAHSPIVMDAVIAPTPNRRAITVIPTALRRTPHANPIRLCESPHGEPLVSAESGGRIGTIWSVQRLASFAWSFAAYAAGLAVAAAVLRSVAVTPQGVVIAAAIIATPQALYDLLLGDLAERAQTWSEDPVSRSGCAFIVLMFVGLLLPVPLVILVEMIAPGFDVDGFWSYVITVGLVAAMPLLTFQPYLLVRRLRGP